jgi:hypothetical protein
MRLYLPLLPIPVLAALVALSCSRTRSEDPATHVIPPPAPYHEPAAQNAAAAAAAPRPAADEPPSADEVKAFQRPVPK